MTIRTLIRWLGLDTSAERAEDRAMRARGLAVAEAAAAGDDTAYEQQRRALSEAVMRREVTEETARELINDIDLRQAAGRTRE